jgi:hypothetical protein
VTTCPQPNIYPGIPFATYQQWDAVNASMLTMLSRRSPWHAHYEQTHSKESDALRVGRALHSYLLEPATFPEFWAVRPECDRRTKVGKELYAAFMATKGGRDEVTAAEFAEIEALAALVRQQQCVNLICGGRAEVCLVWEDAQTSLVCKRRLDYERTDGWNHVISDLKTCRDISPRAFSNDIARYGYALAAAFSIDGWKAVTGDDSLYALLAVEKEYGITKVWEPGERTLEAGRAEYQAALKRTKECMTNHVWPAYGTEAELIEAPEWYLQLHGAGRDRLFGSVPSDPAYVVGPEPETDDEIDDYLK